MNQQDINYIKEKLHIIVNQPLQSVSRGGGSIFISFGELIEKDAWNRNEAGEKINVRKILIGKYALHIECNSRFICGDKVVLAKYDLYKPVEAEGKKEDFDWESFDWDVKGGNRFDELASILFSKDSPKFIVEKVAVSRVGDIKIKFTNGFVFEVIIDTSEDDECWRFFESGKKDDPHLVITGTGISEGL